MGLITGILEKAYNRLNNHQRVNHFLRYFYNKKNRMRLRNKDISLISSNCNGGIILHDLNLRFNSPFVNLWLKPKDFIRMCEHLDYYMNIDHFQFIDEEGVSYPIGLLDDIKIYFQHYSSKEEAETAWNRRKKRMNMNKLFFLFSDRDGCEYEDIKRFDNLSYKNKKIFVNKTYPEIKSAIHIPGFEENDSVGYCMNFKNNHSGYRYLDSFDYVKWFNEGE